MATDSRAPTPPRTSRKKSGRRRRSRPRISYGRIETRHAKVATKLRKSRKRCLAAACLIERRLELLASLDYKPLFSLSGKTLAGEMFDLRLVERDSDIESLIEILGIDEGSPDLDKQVNQYNSALTATEADFALLKLLILLREYATHTSRFLAFIDEYEPPDDLDLSFLGETNLELITNVCSIDFADVLEEATTILAQLLLILNCSVYGLTPYNLTDDGYEDAISGKLITRFIAEKSDTFVETLYSLANISRDLTFSREMVRIREDAEPDAAYKELIEDILGKNFINSANDINLTIMSDITGTSTFSNLKTSMSHQNEVRKSGLSAYIDNKSGALSTLLYRNSILIPETNETEYNNKTYDTIDPLIDDAFSGEKVLDFTKFSEVIENFTSAFQRVAYFGKESFRLLDKASDSDGTARGDLPLVQNEQPLSMSSISAAIYEVFNRRFADTLWTSITSEFYDWLEPEHINYNRVLGWLLIRDNPELAREIVYGFFDDYNKGMLTCSGLPEPIEGSAELDEEGNEVEGTERLTELVYVKPGSTTPVNLTGVGSRLNGKIYKLNHYYADTVPQMSPSNTLSQNGTDAVSYPGIRTQYERIEKDFFDYFGSASKGADATSDLRLVNTMWGYYYRRTTVTGTDAQIGELYTRQQYLGSKIVAAEIIDAVLDVMRSLVSPFAEVPAASDGDPVFPFVPQMKNPYGTDSGKWGFSGAGYEHFQMASWINTVEEFKKLFVRTNSDTTYMRQQEIRKIGYKIVDIFSWMMTHYDFLTVRSETLTSANTAAAPMAGEENPAGAYMEGMFGSSKMVWFNPTCINIKFTSNGSYPGATSDRQDISSDTNVKDHINALSTILEDLLEASFEDFDNTVENIKGDLPTIWGGHTIPTSGALTSYAEMIQNAKREDDMLAFQHDFLEKYAERVNNYKQAAVDLVEGEGSPMADFVTMVRGLGDAGTDILQNLSVNQLALKQVALEEEKADPDKGYLPRISILSRGEKNAIKGLCKQNILRSPEGNTTRVLMVGIPLNTFDQNEIDNDFCLRVSYRDIEYPQLVFRSKSYKFDKDLYILPENLDNLSSSSSFNSMLNAATFSRIRVEVEESTDISASIQLIDEIEEITRSASERTTNRDIFSNLLISEIIKLYYRVMLGVSFSEVAFLSTSDELKIPISDSSSDLATSLADKLVGLSSVSPELGSSVGNLLNSITAFENPDDFVSGEITPVDESLLGDLANAFQSRLFSPEVLRNRTLAAKMFDRIYAIPVDPDEFYIVKPGQPQIGQTSDNPGGVATPEEVFDYYLNAGIIESTGLDAPYEYKLAPRKSAEGSMAFGAITVSLTTVDDEAEGILEL